MEEENKLYTIILRHDTSTNWMINNPILALGEYGVEDDTHRVKRGDGESAWDILPYEHFGLEYIVTFSNLKGEVSDNSQLNEILLSKVSKSTFSENDGYVITGLQVLSEEGAIGKIIKTSTNVTTNSITSQNVVIISDDNSIKGTWNVDETGAKILNLKAAITLDVFTPQLPYGKNQLCIYNNKIYRAKDSFISGDIFNATNWIMLTSMMAEDILFEHNSGLLSSNNVQDAIDETVRYASTKVDKTTEAKKVYGTDKNSNQVVYDIDSLRKVDTVNHIKPDINKNVQIDSNDINYDDSILPAKTIKQVLDSKVDKNVAGEGNTIVQNVSVTLDETNGDITFTTNNLSLETGDQGSTSQTINVVSETELNTAVTNINKNIDDEVNNINKEIVNQVNTINQNMTKGLDTKVDKSIADSLISNIELNTNTSSIDITNNSTTSDEQEVTSIGFKTTGNIQVETNDNNITINSTDIDNNVAANKAQLLIHEESIVAINKHLANHEAHLATHDTQIAQLETESAAQQKELDNLNDNAVLYNSTRDIMAEGHIYLESGKELLGFNDGDQNYHVLAMTATYNKGQQDQFTQNEIGSNFVHMNINSNDRPTIELSNKQKEEVSYKSELDAQIQNSNTEIETLTNTKLDKDFNKNINNNLVGEMEITGPENDILFNISKSDISTSTNDIIQSSLQIKSSDNTLVATPIMTDGVLTGIDLATNLDTDVHYFITSETLNTEIPSENEIPKSSLTATTNPEVEVEDIISDPEGTWARVQEINGDTIKCVTFKKHAQAVWGTIKGDIQEQQDLQDEFNTKISKTFAAGKELMTGLSMDLADTDEAIGADKNGIVIYAATVDPTKTYKPTDPTMSQTELWFKSTDQAIDFNISKDHTANFTVNSENIVINPQSSGLIATKLGSALRELSINKINKNFANGGLLISKLGMELGDSRLSPNGDINKLNILTNSLDPTKDTNSTNIFQTALSFTSVDKALEFMFTNIEQKEVNIKINSENIAIDPETSGLQSTTIAPAIRELQTNKIDKNFSGPYNLITSIGVSVPNRPGVGNVNNELALNIYKISPKSTYTEDDPVISNSKENVNFISPDKSINFEGSFSQNANIKVDSENVIVDKQDLGFTDNTLASMIRELYTMIQAKPNCISYKQGIEIKEGDLVYCLRGDGLAYMGVAQTNFTSSTQGTTRLESFEADVTSGNIARMTIPNEASPENNSSGGFPTNPGETTPGGSTGETTGPTLPGAGDNGNTEGGDSTDITSPSGPGEDEDIEQGSKPITPNGPGGEDEDEEKSEGKPAVPNPGPGEEPDEEEPTPTPANPQ